MVFGTDFPTTVTPASLCFINYSQKQLLEVNIRKPPPPTKGSPEPPEPTLRYTQTALALNITCYLLAQGAEGFLPLPSGHWLCGYDRGWHL